MVQEKSSRVYAATLLVRTLIIKNIFIHQNQFSFSCSFVSVSSALLCFLHSVDCPIVLINNLHKSIHSKDLNCSMSPSFIALILLPSENKSQTFLLKFNSFRLLKLPACSTSALQSSSLNQPQHQNESVTRWFQLLKLRNCSKSILLFMQIKPKTKSTEKYSKKTSLDRLSLYNLNECGNDL
jgi:hypothetical protein